MLGSSCEPSCWVRFTVPLANRLRETLAEHVEFSVHLHRHAPADDDGRAIVVTGDKVTADKDRDLHQSEEAGLGGDPGDLDSGSIVVTCCVKPSAEWRGGDDGDALRFGIQRDGAAHVTKEHAKTIVGVVGDAHMLKIAATDLGEMYSPLNPAGYANYQLIARARTDAERLIGPMRRAARAADDRVLAQATLMRAEFHEKLRVPRLASSIAGRPRR